MPRQYRRAYQCPYYIRETVGGLKCEGGEILLPSSRAFKDHTECYCTNAFGWRHCSIAITLQKYYDRKERCENGKS